MSVNPTKQVPSATSLHRKAKLVFTVGLVVWCCVLTGCFSLAVHGEADQVGPVAVIMGDPHLRIRAPVNVYLRSVDNQPLSFWQSRARVPAGARRLLVDCTVVATDNTSRYELNVELEAGLRYRLSAEATSQKCTAVNLDGVQ